MRTHDRWDDEGTYDSPDSPENLEVYRDALRIKLQEARQDVARLEQEARDAREAQRADARKKLTAVEAQRAQQRRMAGIDPPLPVGKAWREKADLERHLHKVEHDIAYQALPETEKRKLAEEAKAREAKADAFWAKMRKSIDPRTPEEIRQYKADVTKYNLGPADFVPRSETTWDLWYLKGRIKWLKQQRGKLLGSGNEALIKENHRKLCKYQKELFRRYSPEGLKKEADAYNEKRRKKRKADKIHRRAQLYRDYKAKKKAEREAYSLLIRKGKS